MKTSINLSLVAAVAVSAPTAAIAGDGAVKPLHRHQIAHWHTVFLKTTALYAPASRIVAAPASEPPRRCVQPGLGRLRAPFATDSERVPSIWACRAKPPARNIFDVGRFGPPANVSKEARTSRQQCPPAPYHVQVST
jgi:hypothetical protein